MTPLILKRGDTPRSYEKYLGLAGLSSRELRIPKTLTSSGVFGGALALSQFILTWARSSKNPTISCYLTSEDLEGQRDFVSRVHGLAAAYFASKVRADDSETIDLRRRMLACAKPRVEAMFRGAFRETSKGSSVEMVFVQGAEREFHGAFYRRAPTPFDLADRERHGDLIRDKGEISSFAEECFRAIGLGSKQEYLFDWPDFALGSILAEAFRNTAEHAYLSPDGCRFGKNLRCVRIAREEVSRAHLRDYELSSEAASREARKYFDSTASLERFKGTKRDNVQFVEVSIFDSGVGFASTMGAFPGDRVTTDLGLVAKCFRKHGTSKGIAAGGAGLFRILEAVHIAGGFIRVRTSRAEAFFCGGEGFHPSMDAEDYIHPCKEHVEGSLLTIGIPIKY